MSEHDRPTGNPRRETVRGTMSPRAENPESVPVRPAATVMILRDDDAGLEVFMQQRNHGSEFVAGLYVFPGGGVDPEDSEPAAIVRCAGRTDADASQRVDEESGGLRYWIAAIRETFEESGLLLAYDSAGQLLRFGDPATAARFGEHRVEVDQGRRTLHEVCETEHLTLAADTMHYYSRWITPLGPKRRYDTRFFVAPAPPEQIASNDAREAIADLWISPAQAIDQHGEGRLGMLPPTLITLQELAEYTTVDSVLTAVAPHREVPAILPKRIAGSGGGADQVILPGDPAYDTL